MTEEHQGLHVKFNFLNKRVSELEKTMKVFSDNILDMVDQIAELREKFDNRCIDIETIIGLNFKGDVKRITPLTKQLNELKGKIEGLGENLWDMKTKKEWSKIPEIIEEIVKKEDD